MCIPKQDQLLTVHWSVPPRSSYLRSSSPAKAQRGFYNSRRAILQICTLPSIANEGSRHRKKIILGPVIASEKPPFTNFQRQREKARPSHCFPCAHKQLLFEIVRVESSNWQLVSLRFQNSGGSGQLWLLFSWLFSWLFFMFESLKE